jgi:hypothetical protein
VCVEEVLYVDEQGVPKKRSVCISCDEVGKLEYLKQICSEELREGSDTLRTMEAIGTDDEDLRSWKYLAMPWAGEEKEEIFRYLEMSARFQGDNVSDIERKHPEVLRVTLVGLRGCQEGHTPRVRSGHPEGRVMAGPEINGGYIVTLL